MKTRKMTVALVTVLFVAAAMIGLAAAMPAEMDVSPGEVNLIPGSYVPTDVHLYEMYCDGNPRTLHVTVIWTNGDENDLTFKVTDPLTHVTIGGPSTGELHYAYTVPEGTTEHDIRVEIMAATGTEGKEYEIYYEDNPEGWDTCGATVTGTTSQPVCDLSVVKTATPDTIVLSPAPNCDTEGKPTSLTFKYTGSNCSASDHGQGDKAKCSGDPDGAEPVRIIYTGKDPAKITVSPIDELINVGDLVTVEATGRDRLHSNTRLEIWQGTNLLQSLEIHTSCSQPLEVEWDVFGSLELVAFNGQQATDTQVTYTYVVTNNGSNLMNVTVLDDKLGTIAGPFNLGSGETQTFTKDANISETTTNLVTVTGLLADGDSCSATDTATVMVDEPCGECKGGVTELTLRYIGAVAALIQVYEGKDPKPDKLLFEETVAPDGNFTFSGIRADSTMSSEIRLFVDGQLNTKIHTSCSQPIGPGLVSGDFDVVAGTSRDGGPLCPPFGECVVSPALNLEIKKKNVKWTITNNGGDSLIVKSIELTWPESNGNLKKVKLDGVIYVQEQAPPSTTIDSGWHGKINDRTIEPGMTEKLEFKFKNGASTDQIGYGIRVEFLGEDCMIKFPY